MSLRIGILTHSTNPRGGVVHAMQLAEALCDAGHDAVLCAPDVTGTGFFRQPRCETMCIPAARQDNLPDMVERRIKEIKNALPAKHFDVLHAQDPITANALADMAENGAVHAYARTVHHLDRFEHQRLNEWQDRGVITARNVLCVSHHWQMILLHDYGIEAVHVGNGIDTRRYTPSPDIHDQELRRRLGIQESARIILAIGGIEKRKNTITLLQAFLLLHRKDASAHLLIAGGASLLDHSAYREQFYELLRESDASHAVTVIGVIPDHEMPALYRQAALFAYPSVSEGFGLCPLEALACGIPTVVSRIPPFTEHLSEHDAIWCSPDSIDSVRQALERALSPDIREAFFDKGPRIAAQFSWPSVASLHLPIYEQLMQEKRLHA